VLASSSRLRGEDLNTQLINATVKITDSKSTATAFILSRPAPGNPQKNQFVLITAAHALASTTSDEVTLFFRRQETEGIYKKLPVRIPIRKDRKPLWTRHPTADVAVMLVVPPSECGVPLLSLELLATDDLLRKNEIHPGDTLASLGYPHRVEANEAGFPILRNGPIASYPLLPTKTQKTFLVAMNSFEGDSGAPVYLAERRRQSGEKQSAIETRLILGLVVGQHFMDEEAKLIYEAIKVRHRLGLAIVAHAAFIKETIERMPGN
jgi:hypothetical protein